MLYTSYPQENRIIQKAKIPFNVSYNSYFLYQQKTVRLFLYKEQLNIPTNFSHGFKNDFFSASDAYITGRVTQTWTSSIQGQQEPYTLETYPHHHYN